MTISIPLAIIVIIILNIFVYLYFKRKSSKLFLPHNWIWEESYVKQSRFKKSSTNPVYYYKQLNLKDKQSKETKLFQYLTTRLGFENVPMENILIISSSTLAQSVSNYRKILIERMKSSPAIFRNQDWTEKSNSSWRRKTMNHSKS